MKIISGAQTGVDLGALDFAIEKGWEHGGWCPRGRYNEAGRIPDKYLVKESYSPLYSVRTLQNVRDGDGTLILHRGRLSGGTALTLTYCERLRMPHLVVPLDGVHLVRSEFRRWLEYSEVKVLNVAGPRESRNPGIQEETTAFLHALFPST